MDLSAEVETGTALSLPSPDRFSASYLGWEARAVVSSAPIEAHTLQLQGVRIMNYIDDWLILAQSHQLAVWHRDVVLAHMKNIGVTAKRQEKCAFSITKVHFPGRDMGLNVDAGTPVTGTYSVHPVSCKKYKARPVTHCKQFQRLLGLMAAASNVTAFGLLYMRPLQWWLRTKGFSPRGNPFSHNQGHTAMLTCLDNMEETLVPVPGSHVGSFMSSWRSSQDLWKDHHLSWHINRLEMLAVFLALEFPSRSQGPPCARLLRQHIGGLLHKWPGGFAVTSTCKLACQILLWSQEKSLSLRAAYISEVHNIGTDILSRQGLRPGELRLHPDVVELMNNSSTHKNEHLFVCLDLLTRGPCI